MRKPFLALLFAAALPWSGAAAPSAPAHLTAAAVDARVILPHGVRARSGYVRYYVLRTLRSEADLPFSSGPTFRLSHPREVWAALFIRTPSVFTTQAPGLHVVDDPGTFPQVVHGGCLAVNVVADARTGATLGSWCDGLDLAGRPRTVPVYLPAGSAIKVR